MHREGGEQQQQQQQQQGEEEQQRGEGEGGGDTLGGPVTTTTTTTLTTSPSMDDGQGGPQAGSDDDGAVSTSLAPQPWDDDLPFQRNDFIRVISSCLKGLGYNKASRALQEESGQTDPDDRTTRMLSFVSCGRWREALDLLSSVQFPDPSLHVQAQALLLRNLLADLVEDSRLDEALTCLRQDLAPLFSRGDGWGGAEGHAAAAAAAASDDEPVLLQPMQLHALSTLLLAPAAAAAAVAPLRRPRPSSSSPAAAAASSKAWVSATRTAARSDARVALQGLLAKAGMAIPPGRLENLVAQAITLQTMNCVYHNTPEHKLDLTADHSCELKMVPQVSTHVFDDHEDEVWCCRFSNGGGMLATSSADAVLILWDVGGGGSGGVGGGRQRRGAPFVHKRIQVRDGAPQAIAWSPDDRWLLTCGGSSEVTRWVAATGAEARCYGGEHTEAVTGVAWLRDGRGFVSVGMDRKVVVWSLGGIVLSCWNCNTRITGIVVAPPPQPLPPRPSPPLSEKAAAAATATASAAATARGSNNDNNNISDQQQHWSNEHWPLEAAGAAAAAAVAVAGGTRVNNGMVGNGGGGTGGGTGRSSLLPQPQPQPLNRQHGKEQQRGKLHQQRWQREQSPRSLRRCRAWIICQQDTIQALDIEVTDYGEPPPPPPPPPLPPPSPPSRPGVAAAEHHGNGMNGAAGNGGGGEQHASSQNGSSISCSAGRHAAEAGGGGGGGIKVEEILEDEGDDGGATRLRNGDGSGGGLSGGARGGESPRFTPRRKSGGSCSIEEGAHQYFEGNIISSISASRDGSQHLLLHMDRARICSWSSTARKVVENYEGHHQGRYIVRSTFGGLNDRFVASGSEDSLVYLWHRTSGELIGSLPGHAGTVNAVHWNPSVVGMLASVSDDQTVRIWEPPPPLPRTCHPQQQQQQQHGDSAASKCGGGGGKEAGERRDGGPPTPSRNRSGDQKYRAGGAGAIVAGGGGGGRVKVKKELEEERKEAPGLGRAGGSGSSGGSSSSSSRRGGGSGSRGSKKKGKSRRRRWGYGLAPPSTAAAAAGQAWEGWEGGSGGGGEGYNDGGYSARIAALRW
ncbi:unnamed protein product [Pylaiella littoralis]